MPPAAEPPWIHGGINLSGLLVVALVSTRALDRESREALGVQPPSVPRSPRVPTRSAPVRGRAAVRCSSPSRGGEGWASGQGQACRTVTIIAPQAGSPHPGPRRTWPRAGRRRVDRAHRAPNVTLWSTSILARPIVGTWRERTVRASGPVPQSLPRRLMRGALRRAAAVDWPGAQCTGRPCSRRGRCPRSSSSTARRSR